MKNTLRAILVLLIAILTLSGCARETAPDEDPETDAEKSFTLYASFYPLYAISAMIINDDIPGMTLHCLVQPQDGCLRSYELSDWDLYLAAGADAIILGGRGLESFETLFSGLGENGPSVVTLLNNRALLGQNGEDAGDEANTGHFAGANPWLFLSVNGAMEIAEAVTANMLVLDAPYEDRYAQNLTKAKEQLIALKADMASTLSGAPVDTPVALLHEGLIYVANELGLNTALIYERESGENTDYEAYDDLSARLKSSGARTILIEKQAPDMLINRLRDEGYAVALIDTLSTGREDMGAEGYFAAMRRNAESVSAALSEGKAS